MPAAIENVPKVVNERHERVAGLVGHVDRVRLRRHRLETERSNDGFQRCGQRRPRVRRWNLHWPRFEISDPLDETRLPVEALRLAERQQERPSRPFPRRRTGRLANPHAHRLRARRRRAAGLPARRGASRRPSRSRTALRAEARTASGRRPRRYGSARSPPSGLGRARRTPRSARSAAEPVPAPRRPRGSRRSTPSARFERASTARTRSTTCWEKYAVPEACPSSPEMSSPAPLAEMISSVAPSCLVAVARIVWFMVSPVARAAAMIVVPSISPTTIRAERERRRPTLRTPSLSSTRLRTASSSNCAGEDSEQNGEDRHQAVHRYAEQLFHPSPLAVTAAGSSASTTSYRSRPGDALKSVTNFSTCSL